MLQTLIASRKVRVVIVDDTRSIRAMIRALLIRSPRIEVVGEAGDPYEARELIRELNPDVITLDVVMPRMDGLSFLERLMRLRPMPVVMVSTRTTENSSEAVKALSLGAVDCVDLAALGRKQNSQVNLAETVLMAADSNSRGPSVRAIHDHDGDPPLNWNGKIVTIGSSTGGVDALMTVLSHYPADGPPTVIAQHMPPAFLESFAQRLDRSIAPKVVLARHAMTMAPGTVYLAPGGDWHVGLSARNPLALELIAHDGAEAYVPSVNILFSSAIPHSPRIVGVMLTGMGRDGAEPMREMLLAGAFNIVQDGASCVVDGMPKAARDAGAASKVVPLDKIGMQILHHVSKRQREVSA